ncbi:hypothetical protein KHQ81_13680 [Mycoplasmatota bacterium]|nr:hypothetical protein KHQ81_13680 [Mycoplasmatota bacterium]
MNNRLEEITLALLEMIKKDISLQNELEKTIDLDEGYHPKLESLHLENAEELQRIIYEIGWSTVAKVGPEAAYAAWLILQHAISSPSLQRDNLPLLMELANKNEIYPSEVAVLYDRICYFEFRPQKYGTQFEFDENDELSPWEIEDMNLVDSYRKQVGLPPLEETIKRMREIVKKTNEKPTKSYKERIKERTEWAKKVGWIE